MEEKILVNENDKKQLACQIERDWNEKIQFLLRRRESVNAQ